MFLITKKKKRPSKTELQYGIKAFKAPKIPLKYEAKKAFQQQIQVKKPLGPPTPPKEESLKNKFFIHFLSDITLLPSNQKKK